MLNLAIVRKQMNALVESSVNFQSDVARKLEVASSELQNASEHFSEWTERIKNSKTSWLVAKFSQKPNGSHSPPPRPAKLSVLCVDGSQIPPDRHQIAPCYLINIGRIVIHYGTQKRPQMESKPELFFKEEHLYETVNENRLPVEGSILSDKRTAMEWKSLEELIESSTKEFADVTDHSSIAIIDGSLIRWSLETRRGIDQYRNKMLGPTLKTFDTARCSGVPVVGYISSPGSSDVINALKVNLCSLSPVNCDECKKLREENEKECKELEGINDKMLFQEILEPGQRSVPFESNSEILKYYHGHRIHFFYLKLTVGNEIARVEVPQWVIKNEEMINLVHSAIVDQTEKGMGYPVVLTEAHEKAVIRSKDRDMFYRLLSNLYVQRGMPAIVSRKNISKKVPRV